MSGTDDRPIDVIVTFVGTVNYADNGDDDDYDYVLRQPDLNFR